MPVHRLVPSARSAALLAALAATVTLAACAGEPSGGAKEADLTGPEGAVQATVDRFSSAAKRDDSSGMCRDLITPKLRKQLTTADATCAQNLQNAIDHADYTSLVVTAVKLDGGPTATTAVANTKLVESKTATRQVLLSLPAGTKTWLIDGVAVPKPAGTTPKSTSTTPKS